METHDYFRLLGLILWLVTYVLILWTAHRDKRYGLPFPATCLFLTYSLYSLFLCPSNAGELCDPEVFAPGAPWLLWVALLLELILFVQFLLYGFRNPIVPEEKTYFLVLVLAGLALGFGFHYTFIPSFPNVDGHLLGYWMTAFVGAASFLILFFFRAKDAFLGLSYWSAITKLSGNLLIAGTFVFESQDTLPSVFYYLFFSVLSVDLAYVGLMQFRHLLGDKGDTGSAALGPGAGSDPE